MAILTALPGAVGRSFRERFTQPVPEELQSFPDPSDVANVALGASAISTLEAAIQGPEAPPPLVDDGSAPAVVVDDTEKAIAGGADGASVEDPDTEALMGDSRIDMMARATQEVERQTAQIGSAKTGKSPLVSMATCAKAAKQLKAMSCSLVTQISGYPEGCECRMRSKTCPAVSHALGFTGVSPSFPFSPPELGGSSVILCMYWQWLAPQDTSLADRRVKDATTADAESLVRAAHFHATEGARKVATVYYAAATPPPIFTSTFPIPATPMPIIEPLRFMATPPPLTGFPAVFR
jgi:hypothetical protein